MSKKNIPAKFCKIEQQDNLPAHNIKQYKTRQLACPLAKVSFEKTKTITYEQYRLFARTQESREILKSFHAALSAQATTAEVGGLEEELVRDLFISRIKNTALQDTLTFETFAPDEVLKRAIKFERSKQTT